MSCPVTIAVSQNCVRTHATANHLPKIQELSLSLGLVFLCLVIDFLYQLLHQRQRIVSINVYNFDPQKQILPVFGQHSFHKTTSIAQLACKDVAGYCTYWKSKGLCDGRYAPYMKKNCRKTCDKCM